ncbi:MipA/OmpV family protein [Corallincola platygyrae]|uniref:MipA/OmpV family protein n=1 Tax=Corallincola platygyrae TaxID=1193278 RepID=A0ABW4XNQ9_9GAMM
MKYSLALASLLLPSIAMAQDGETLSVGAGFVLQNSAYADYDDDNRFVPIIKFENEHFFADKGGLGYKLFDNKQHRIGVIVGVGKDEWDSGNTSRFRELDNRHRSIDAGLSYQFQDRQYGQFSASVMTDISDDHNGVTVDLGYGYPFPINEDLMLIPNISLTYMDSDYANYYYGISDKEAARTSFDAYDTGSAMKYGVGIAANYKINDEWSLTGGASYTMLDSDIEDSPLIDDDKETSVFVGVSYKFW